MSTIINKEGVSKFGYNSAVGASAEDIWSPGGSYTGWLTAASAVRVASGGNANDTAAGTGARAVMIEGLDEDWLPAREEVATAGASASSATTTTFIRVFRAYVTDCGAYGGGATADITIETTGATTVAVIETGENQTEMAIYTVPSGYKATLISLDLTVESSNAADVRFFQRSSADTVSAPFSSARLIHREPDITGHVPITFHEMIEFGPKTDLWVDAVRTGGSNANVRALFILRLHRI